MSTKRLPRGPIALLKVDDGGHGILPGGEGNDDALRRYPTLCRPNDNELAGLSKGDPPGQWTRYLYSQDVRESTSALTAPGFGFVALNYRPPRRLAGPRFALETRHHASESLNWLLAAARPAFTHSTRAFKSPRHLLPFSLHSPSHTVPYDEDRLFCSARKDPRTSVKMSDPQANEAEKNVRLPIRYVVLLWRCRMFFSSRCPSVVPRASRGNYCEHR